MHSGVVNLDRHRKISDGAGTVGHLESCVVVADVGCVDVFVRHHADASGEVAVDAVVHGDPVEQVRRIHGKGQRLTEIEMRGCVIGVDQLSFGMGDVIIGVKSRIAHHSVPGPGEGADSLDDDRIGHVAVAGVLRGHPSQQLLGVIMDAELDRLALHLKDGACLVAENSVIEQVRSQQKQRDDE